jgi:outer membrane lipoprotein SlyB
MFGRGAMTGVLIAAGALAVEPVSAQEFLGDALLGGAAGAIIGGAVTGRAGGAAAGAIIGATAGAIIGEEGRRNRRGYYAYKQGCYVQRRDGSWVRVQQRHCY